MRASFFSVFFGFPDAGFNVENTCLDSSRRGASICTSLVSGSPLRANRRSMNEVTGNSDSDKSSTSSGWSRVCHLIELIELHRSIRSDLMARVLCRISLRNTLARGFSNSEK